MAFSLYDASIPVLVRMLATLSSLLTKGAESAAARKIDPSVFTTARLAPDMIPLSGQVQLACDAAKGCAARLSGTSAPSHPDTEVTFEDLQARIAKTVEYLKSITAQQLDGAEDRDIVMKFPSGEMKFTGHSFLVTFALPNFFFHIVTAYNILRHNGVALGKMDYLSGQ